MSKKPKNLEEKKETRIIDEEVVEQCIWDVERLVNFMILQGYDGVTIASALLGVGKKLMTSQIGVKDTKKAIERLATYKDFSLIHTNYTIH